MARRFRRAPVGTMAIRVDGPVRSTWSVVNVSAGGALLAAEIAPPVDERLRLLLHLQGLAPFAVDARVLRHEPGGDGRTNFAVRFDGISARRRTEVQETVLSWLRARTAAWMRPPEFD